MQNFSKLGFFAGRAMRAQILVHICTSKSPPKFRNKFYKTLARVNAPLLATCPFQMKEGFGSRGFTRFPYRVPCTVSEYSCTENAERVIAGSGMWMTGLTDGCLIDSIYFNLAAPPAGAAAARARRGERARERPLRAAGDPNPRRALLPTPWPTH